MMAGNLSKIKLLSYIKTRKDNVIENLYRPCLVNSSKYVRGAGYFRSSVYSLMTADILDFCIKGGKITLLTSTEWGREDFDRLRRSYDENKLSKDFYLSELESLLLDEDLSDPTRMLIALVHSGKLDIKIGILRGAIYHEKKGYFKDDFGNIVAFDGSGNESFSGLQVNHQSNSFNVSWSWNPVDWKNRGLEWKKDLDDTLKGNDFPVESIDTVDPEFIQKWDIETNLESYQQQANKRQQILKTKWDETYDNIVSKVDNDKSSDIYPKPPFDIPEDLYDHQKRGIKIWKGAGKRGILEYATGSGKTITAISVIKEHIDNGNNSIVLVPSEHLLFQWQEEIEKFIPYVTIGLLGGGKKEGEILNEMRFQSEKGTILISIIQSFRDDKVQRKLSRLINTSQELLLVVDECHRIGAPSYSDICEKEFTQVLGLSATPDVEGRPEYNKRIRKLLSTTLDRYSLTDALTDGHLSPFEYHIHTVNLTAKEQHDYDKLRSQIRKYLVMLKKGEPMPKHLEILIYKSRAIIRGAENKISKSIELLKSEFQEGQHWLIYCDNENMMNKITSIIREETGINPRKYWSGMNRFERKSELNFFKKNGGVIIAIKCLDEGVDVPAISHGLVLSSSKTKREWIQRRGRLLRKSENKEKSVIFDVLALPSSSGHEISFVVDEVKRASEFSESCINTTLVKLRIEKICREYNINLLQVVADKEEWSDDIKV